MGSEVALTYSLPALDMSDSSMGMSLMILFVNTWSTHPEYITPCTFTHLPFFELVTDTTRISSSFANNHVRIQVDFYGEKVDYIKKQESDDWRFIEKYIDVFHIPQIYEQFYDLSEYEYIRKEVEELYKEDMIFFGY